ncbi:RNA 2',3'-cyclic phosphodiesterase [Pseudomonas plecoglossicida]|jgi:2'-5' RNA ligase|uniref:RNA 2',3'-cyclic phosphodiesterase n=1 Tax=Pseudomonas plecoglossicida TaxID=70775 RepID=A0ABX4U5V7_PSEDL|nr:MULTISPECIES: RNA 2',3'-cyclic phosphodiesterase [Pseudomonas]TXI06115.1 MAG: RNA 2',3'-cyclic phosphodiesterase [Pseudomonas monteilii]CAB5639113.1 2'-5'-RNA ligase [Pseudomonas putida]GJB83025.1 RNA 2',3'-cyclic phosphodiesterase [Aeromonas caviae]AGA74170.1 2'-5' RNA ligase [Pseudomonas putida HB3267]MBO2924679.1 RNA 2',3'-cyclic phosphodiesterase [Pseudomonas asiatica]
MTPVSGRIEKPFKRLFFALPVSDAQRRALAQWRRGLNLRSGKPVPAANFHVTLLFLGDVDTAHVPAICAVVDQLALPATAPRLLLDRLQVWQRASALVLEAQQTPPALLQLVYSLQQALLPLGVEAADREYRPHLTLARDYRGQPPEASSAPDFYLAARHFTLYESRKGAYWPLAQWPLSG